jgi:TonB family protein
MKSFSAIVFFGGTAIFLCLQAVAGDRQAESALRAALDKKIVVLRGFYVGQHLRFDSSGNPVGKAEIGPWTSDGVIQITRVSAKPDRIVLRGKRVLNAFDSNRCQFTNILTDVPVEIEVQADSASLDADQVLDIVDKIIARDSRALKDLAPDYWKPWVQGLKWVDKDGRTHCGTPADEQPGSVQLPTRSADTNDSSEPRPLFMQPGGTKVFKVGQGVKPPKPLSTRDPDYNEVARQSKFQGTTVLWVVVNERGETTAIRVARPLGAGLDDKAVEAVKKWRFTPATYKGNPVAVQIKVEVNFRLY